MRFKLTEDQELIRSTIRDFAEHEVRPGAAARDRDSDFPADLLKQLGGMGFMGAVIPVEYGGADIDSIAYALVIEELARVDASLAVTVAVHNSVGAYPIVRWGTEEQKRRYLPPMAAGEALGAFALTEPQAGSDAANLKCRAVRDGDRYIVNGVKAWCTNGPVADTIVLMAVTDPGQGSKGISAFILEADTPGFQAGTIEDKMGLRSSKTSELVLDNCAIPAANRLGNEGDGLKVALSVLCASRTGIGAQAVGIAQGAFEEALRYAKVREAFGQPLAGFQATQFKLADMATRIEAARLLVLYAASRTEDVDRRIFRYSSMCKLFASEMANEVVAQAVQIHGGYGFSREYPVERFYRDARVTTIYEGTSEIQRLVIARELLKE
ncbi:MAG TPA: acyl-CoA dehydrogenase family protein [Acidobacteriota bacterium]|nr:acyl-CoA dehydrogenase family protein [Acidobacteriota bacterium]HNU00614.1 acyl-CoA dehydrogenase family protein [Acidobacteriota bacterium]HPB26943.1 acyl-CoA dehydrogenase family protein [Acidobacteriota bacterium]HQO24208.1 acyl-CoA dehydrogenase family protein [Acidobacteriota bacterium]HQP72576.1 acyl-CoA dehydrogenase family protein [Acidobacteriota bacterium]